MKTQPNLNEKTRSNRTLYFINIIEQKCKDGEPRSSVIFMLRMVAGFIVYLEDKRKPELAKELEELFMTELLPNYKMF